MNVTTRLLAVAALLAAASPAAVAAQQRVAAIPRTLLGARVIPDSTTLLGFTDTSGVRIELAVAHGQALDGRTVPAAVIPLEGGTPLWSGKIGPLRVDFGWKVGALRTTDNRRWEFHFSIGEAF